MARSKRPGEGRSPRVQRNAQHSSSHRTSELSFGWVQKAIAASCASEPPRLVSCPLTMLGVAWDEIFELTALTGPHRRALWLSSTK
jgi:hypothetical protein